MPPSAMTGMPALSASLTAIHDRGDLRHAGAGYDPGGADRSGPDADLDAVRARADEVLGRLGGRDVARDQVEIGILFLDPLDRVDHALGMAVRRVHDNDVHAGLEQFGNPFGIIAHADRCADPQPAQLVLAGIRVLDLLLDVLDRDQAAEAEILVHDQEFFDLVLLEDLHRLFEGRPERCGDERGPWS